MQEKQSSDPPLDPITPVVHATPRVFLVRHAVASDDDDDDAAAGDQDRDRGPHLTEIGRRQAEALAARAAGWQLEAIFCSDMHRAMETAAAVRKQHAAVPLFVEPLFREVSAGTVERELDAPDGALRARLEAAWQRIITMPHHVSVIITHNGLIKHLIGRAIRFKESLKPRFHSAYTGISGLAVKPGRHAHLQFFNDVSHLNPDIVDGPKRPWIEDAATGRWHF